MFSHVMIGSNDLDRSKRFYDATFAVLGAKPGFADAKGRLVYSHSGAFFMITKPIDGKPAIPGNGCTVGLAMASREQADAWHEAGVASGGTAVEDPPGLREDSNLYLAYLRDPDGNKLCALLPGSQA
jgi:catechol 2,3-dioxygenase-like lactoylglutathione lyase family enzyme